MDLSEHDRLKVAIETLLTVAIETDNLELKSRIEIELQQLQMLNASLQGIPVNWKATPELENPIGILRLWKEVKAERKEIV